MKYEELSVSLHVKAVGGSTACILYKNSQNQDKKISSRPESKKGQGQKIALLR